MSLYAQLLLNAIQIGAVYVLFSLGLTIIFGVMKVVNFAHGEFFTAAALVVSVLVSTTMQRFGIGIFPAFAASVIVAMVVVMAVGAVIYRFGFALYLRDMTGSFILSLGLLLLMQGVMVEIFTGVPRVVPAFSEQTMNILGAHVRVQGIAISAFVLVLSAGVIVAIKQTKLGMALRAVSEDHEAAMLQGINYGRIAFLGFMFGTALAAVAGCIIAPLAVITPFTGSDYLIRAFIIVIIGRLGSIPGTVIAGFLVALVDSLGGYYFDPSTTTIALFAGVIGLLIFRPEGILSRAER